MDDARRQRHQSSSATERDAPEPSLDWSGTGRAHVPAPLLVHWIDEKGAVVRLISSTGGDDLVVSPG
jgi:hypothetical protein